MFISHHIAMELAAERQRDLRASSRRGWRLPFGRRFAELEPVVTEPHQPVVAAAGGDGSGPAPMPAPPLDAPRRRITHGRIRHGAAASAQGSARRRDRAGV